MSTDGDHDDCELYRIVVEHARKITALEELLGIGNREATVGPSKAGQLLGVSRQTAARRADRAGVIERTVNGNIRIPLSWVLAQNTTQP